MATRVTLHIGAPKTGSTYLQTVLFRNRARLHENGVLLPGLERSHHGYAATGVRQGPGGRRHGHWQRLVDEVGAWKGSALVSNEWFAMASEEKARLALRDLGDQRVHLVFTARDFLEQVPSAWQETLKLGAGTSLDDFVRALERPRGRWRWSVLDPVQVLDRWRGDLPASSIHVVTYPPRAAGADVLWQRFAAACGLDPDEYRSRVGGRRRESIGVESARLLQDMGPQLRAALDSDGTATWRDAYTWIQRYLSHRLLVPRGGGRIALRPADVAAIRERSDRTVEGLENAGYDVVGDLEDLRSATVPADARHPSDVTDAELLSVATAVIPQILARARAEQRRAAGTRREPAPARAGEQPASPPRTARRTPRKAARRAARKVARRVSARRAAKPPSLRRR